jgi:hypothetical protein
VDAGGNNIYFSTQTNDLSSNFWTYVSAPISWNTNFFHFIVLTYCATNTALYLDDTLVTNGPPMAVYPGLNALTNGFWIGSSSNGLNQSHGLFDLVATYNYPLDSNDIDAMFNWYYPNYVMNPYNIDYMDFNSSSLNFSGYGTNLALAPISISNNLASLFVVNSFGDVMYEIQGTTNLAQPNWFSLGFVYGSELTNLTLANVMVTNRPVLFLRIRSWISGDGSGLPDWWELLYFGHTGIDPDALDSAGDGWTIWQDFENGYNPTIFHTPPAPQNLAAVFNSVASTANIGWRSSLGLVTGYTVQKYDQWTRQTTTTNFSQSVNGFLDTITDSQAEKIVSGIFTFDYGPIIPIYYQIQAHYPGGDSAWSAPVLLEPNYVGTGYEAGDLPLTLVPGPQGSTYLAAWGLPNGTATLRVKAVDEYAEINYGNSNFDTIVDIPVSSSTNGLYPLPNSLMAPPADSYGQAQYRWFMQTIDSSNNPSEPMYFTTPFSSRVFPVYLDGRTQLKQNLIFLLRAANQNGPFQFTEVDTNNNPTVFSYPGNYACAGLYLSVSGNGYFDSFLPFEENYRYRNFMLSLSPNQDVDGSGALTTGAGQSSTYPLALLDPPTYQFQPPAAGVTNIAPLLATNVTQWLLAEPYNNPGAVGITVTGSPATYQLAANAQNIFGLQFQSTELAYGTGSGLGTTTLSAGGSATPATSSVNIYSGAAQPQFQTMEYDFWQGSIYLNTLSSGNFIYSGYSGSLLPGMANFSPTNTSDLLIAGVGQPTRVNGYAKFAMLNGYNGVYAYLGQYFDKAYQMTNGVATTNTTGVLSSYGDFFPTQPGPTALVTMPDPDTGQRGTGIVFAISLALDVNHDGVMDTSFSGPDNTSVASPMEAWVNNAVTIPGTNGILDHDVQAFTNSSPNYAAGKITCQRDLENFFRLWICGVPTLPASQGYSVTLSCSAVSGSPAINLYMAETNGGIFYLTDTNTAQKLTGETALGTISSSSAYTFPSNFFDGTNKYFLFEGAGIGEGWFKLTVYKNSNVVAQAYQWLDLHNIKDLYEQACVTNVIQYWPAMVQQPATSGYQVTHYLPSGFARTNQLAVFVHGWRMTEWDYEDFSDTMFKRFYWQGFQGAFASLRWPTRSKDTDTNTYDLFGTQIPADTLTYNRSEHIAFESASGAAAYFNNLRQRFTNDTISVFSHSQGNVLMMEALKELAGAGQAPLDNYVMMQAAVPAQCYDPTVPNYYYFTNEESLVQTPNTYSNYAANIDNALRVGGKIVNFFNTNDYALVSASTNTSVFGLFSMNINTSWIINEQLAKPLAFFGYSYNPSNSTAYLTNTVYGVSGRTVTGPWELMPFVARPRSLTVGSLSGVHGMVNGGELALKSIGFTANDYDHSGQFNRNIQDPVVQLFYPQLRSKLFP